MCSTTSSAGRSPALIERLETDASIKGLILASGKKDFLAGADIDRLRALATRAAGLRRVDALQGGAAPLELRRQAGGRGDQRPVPGRWPRDRAGLPSPHRRSTTARRGWACPRSSWACCPAAAARSACRAWSACSRRCSWMGEGTDVRARSRRWRVGLRATSWRTAATTLLRQGAAWIAGQPEAPRQPWDTPKFRFPGGDSRSAGDGAAVLDRAVDGGGQELRQLSGAHAHPVAACSRAACSTSTPALEIECALLRGLRDVAASRAT